jgi:hypothetical protein
VVGRFSLLRPRQWLIRYTYCVVCCVAAIHVAARGAGDPRGRLEDVQLSGLGHAGKRFIVTPAGRRYGLTLTTAAASHALHNVILERYMVLLV